MVPQVLTALRQPERIPHTREESNDLAKLTIALQRDSSASLGTKMRYHFRVATIRFASL